MHVIIWMIDFNYVSQALQIYVNIKFITCIILRSIWLNTHFFISHNEHTQFWYYCNLKSIFTFTKWIFFNYKIFHRLLWYCHMSSEIIQSVTYDNYNDFQYANFIFSQIFISLFWGLFNHEIDLRKKGSQNGQS